MNDISVEHDIPAGKDISIEELFGDGEDDEEGIIIMGGDPAPDLTAEYAVKAAEEIETEEELAALFAQVENRLWWVEDAIYDFEEGTEERKRSEEITDFWLSLEGKLRNRIFDILRAEGVEIPATRQIVVMKPFMKRNGYIDGRSWWIKAENQK